MLDKSNKPKLSNQAISTLSQFTHKVRESIGVVKISDLVKDHKYAFDIFVQTVLSENNELVSLTLKANSELNIEQHLIQALDAYFKAFKTKAKKDEIVQHNKSFLIKLASYVYGVNVEGEAYREAINQLLLNVDKAKKVFYLDIARSFYPYWVNAHKSLIQNEKIEVENQKESLMELWHEVEKALLSPMENRKLRLYSEAIKNIKLSDKEIDVRCKVAKVILIEQKEYSPTAEGYRRNINNIQHLISSERLKEYIIIVSREFYPFWVDTQPSK